MILDPYRKIKKAALFAGVFLAVAFFSTLIMLGIQKIGQKKGDANPPKDTSILTPEEQAKRQKEAKEAFDAINEARKNAPVLTPEEQAKRQKEAKEAFDAINEARKNAPVLTPEEQAKRQKEAKEAFDAINEANKR